MDTDAAQDLTRFLGADRFGCVLADPPWRFTKCTGEVHYFNRANDDFSDVGCGLRTSDLDDFIASDRRHGWTISARPQDVLAQLA